MPILRTAIIAGNWKMNYGPRQAASFAQEIVPDLGQITRNHSQIMSILCPPAISLQAVREVLDAHPTSGVELGAQNMYYEESGAFTGELAPNMVRELCTSVILGHSERRSYFAETNELVNKKAHAAFKYSLRPIVCIGENAAQYEAGQTSAIIESQIQESLAGFSDEQARELVIAYEPVWAIGTGKAATVEQAGQVTNLIRNLYLAMYGPEAATAVRILYGGSVSIKNIADFINHPDIDGALVGGASLKSDFVSLLRTVAENMQQ